MGWDKLQVTADSVSDMTAYFSLKNINLVGRVSNWLSTAGDRRGKFEYISITQVRVLKNSAVQFSCVDKM